MTRQFMPREVIANDRVKTIRLLVCFLILLLAHLGYKAYVEGAGNSIDHKFFRQGESTALASIRQNPGNAFLPIIIDAERSLYRWSTTGLVPVLLLAKAVGPDNAMLILSSLLITVACFVSYVVLRSEIFSLLFASFLAFGTHLNYMYTDFNIMSFFPFLTYIIINLACFFMIFFQSKNHLLWRIAFVISLVFTALCWEMWLDYASFLILSMIFLFLLKKRLPNEIQTSSLPFSAVALAGIMIAYFAVRLSWMHEFVKPGSEAELMFNYSHLSLAIEDMISNFFTYTYISLTNYLPPYFLSSNSLLWHREQVIIDSLNGFQSHLSLIVIFHHLLFWMFYAGAVTAAFLYFAFRVVQSCWKRPSLELLAVCFFSFLILSGFSTHILIKFRPYLAIPVFTYKCLVSILGATLLFSYLGFLARKKFKTRTAYGIFLSLIFIVLIWGALTRPYWQSEMLRRVNMKGPPDPIGQIF